MSKSFENILIINTGGGLGDALQLTSLFNYINKNLEPKKIYYFSTDLKKFWYENNLKEYAPKNLITIKNFPEHFGDLFKDKEFAKNSLNDFEFTYFDMIIDTQTKLKNTIIYKKIPHKVYITPCLNYLLSKPFFFIKKEKHVIYRIIKYLNKYLKINDKIDYKIDIPQIYINEAKKILNKNLRYIGFSITSGHPSREKEFDLKEIIKVANHYSSDFTPTFFIEDKFENLKKELKKNVKKSFFPEEHVEKNYRRPIFVTTLGSLTDFNISIDNGISHMLSYSKNKTFCFYNKYSDKFKPLDDNFICFDCEKENTSINKIKDKDIINYIKNN